jgi:nitrite reductase (NADH) large subunit
LVIVGNGMAAARVVEEVLERDVPRRFAISVFGDEPCPSYDRLRLASVMNGALAAEHVFHRTPGWYGRNRVRVHWGEQVALISRRSRTVYGAAGTEEHYDALVLATGSSPHFPPIKHLFNPEGARLQGVCDFRTLADCVQITTLAGSARNVVIIGGGVPALEAARGVATQGCRVELIHSGERLLSEEVDDAAAQLLLRRVGSTGVNVRLQRSVTSLIGTERVSELCLDDGTVLPCELLIVATGLIPNTWLAFQCGLTVHAGIAVDSVGRSIDDRRIYALGECTQPVGQTLAHAATIRRQAKLLAEHLTRSRSPVALVSTASRERLLPRKPQPRPVELGR